MARPRRQPDEPVYDDEMAERMAALEQALRPFASHGVRLRKGDRMGTARKLVYDQGESTLLLGDFDRARLLIFGGN
jgi:hypothetical protein